MATKIFKGQDVTLSTTEVAYELGGDIDFPLTTLTILLISGTVQATAAPVNQAPVLNPTYTTHSTAGTRIVLDMQPEKSTLRMKCASAGVVNINW